ncbi:MAG: glycosyltransferase [Desulfovibrionaceae bacterium]|nr:glycosyltransferase [Desulfovibrionaceae bacterium]
MPPASGRAVKKIFLNGELSDLALLEGDKKNYLLGPTGKKREYAFLPPPLNLEKNNQIQGFHAGEELPVLLGSGLGFALETVLEYLEKTLGADFSLAVVDKEDDLLKATGLRRKYARNSNILWVEDATPEEALKKLGQWQLRNSLKPFRCLPHPAYLRLRPDYYGEIRKNLEKSARLNFWEKARYSKFTEKKPKLLLITSGYFLIGEVEMACRRLGLECRLLDMPDTEVAANSFIEQLLNAVLTLKPDFALTINHLGVDREGILPDLLARLELPLASWFVDNPHLIIYNYNNMVSPWISLFSWDADNLPSLIAMGFEDVHYLPLGTDAARFNPPGPDTPRGPQSWRSRVSFVGNSMVQKVDARLKKAAPPEDLRERRQEVAAAFAQSRENSVRTFLEQAYPELLPSFLALDSLERRLSYETMITWEATLLYRLNCVKAILPFGPLIVGDQGWFRLLGQNTGWRYHQELSYYTDLPLFYPCSEINFNCTSQQMKGAVNQRVFDVPASASFLITDWREQIDTLFEPGKEVICYHSPEEAGELTRYYLEHPEKRRTVISAARRRVLREHLYEHRLEELISKMRARYA